MKIKFGIDPTLSRLHLGHWVILNWIKNNLKDNIIDIVLGDFTATIGDPSGKSKTRNKMTYEETLLNAKKLETQIGTLLNNKVQFHYNSSWLKELNIYELMSQWTVNQILQRRDFKERFNNNNSISLLELVYPLLQGYDSVHLKSDLELGGNDQLFNLLVGKEMMGQDIKTFPLLIGLDGTHKMSKSMNNCIYLDESPLDIFSKVMSISDELMNNWIDIFEFNLDRSIHPKELKKDLADAILSSLSYKSARTDWEEIHEKKVITNWIDVVFSGNLVDTFYSSKLFSSKTQIRNLIKQNALKELSDNKYKLGKYYFNIIK